MVQERLSNTDHLGTATSARAPEWLQPIPAILAMSRVAARGSLSDRSKCLGPSPFATILGLHPSGSL